MLAILMIWRIGHQDHATVRTGTEIHTCGRTERLQRVFLYVPTSMCLQRTNPFLELADVLGKPMTLGDIIVEHDESQPIIDPLGGQTCRKLVDVLLHPFDLASHAPCLIDCKNEVDRYAIRAGNGRERKDFLLLS